MPYYGEYRKSYGGRRANSNKKPGNCRRCGRRGHWAVTCRVRIGGGSNYRRRY